jgi:signal transduction histidine kinase
VIRGMKAPYGLLCVDSPLDGELGQGNASFLEAVAGVLASAIDRRQAEERALQAERLAAIGQVVAGLAHESRNALQRSLACLEMLALDLEDRPEALDLVHRTQRAQDHLHKLFEEVRGYAGPVRLEMGEFGVRDIWREAWALLSKQREGRSIQLREELHCASLDLLVDQFRLVQVFRNLFENSLAACADPVEIVVTCEDAVLDGKPALRIAVRDNGPGLNPEQARRVFDPFYTTKTQGTGLGMPIAQRLVEAHGGTLRLVPGGPAGAEFVITLPRAQASQDP